MPELSKTVGTARRSGTNGSGPVEPPEHSRVRVLLVRALLRPELTAVVGTLVAFTFFAFAAGANGFLTATGTENYLEVAAEVGIIAAAATLLMIAGEFDLSVGSMVGAAGILFAYPAVELGWPLWAALLLAMAGACVVGAFNAFFVARIGLPSFLVTLAVLFGLQGVTLGITQDVVDGTRISGVTEALEGDPLLGLFNGEVLGVPVAVIWWIGITVVAAIVLARSRFGNWVYGCGGAVESAVKAGVPVGRVKLVLFVGTAMSAALVGVLAIFTVDSAEVSRGTLKELQVITAAVIGGTAVTGGYGSPIGTAIGALFFGMVSQGFFFTNIPDVWFQAFLGGMLLTAVVINRYTLKLSMRKGH